MSDSRTRSRVSGKYEVELFWKGKRALVLTENLSLKGMLCLAPKEMPVLPGDHCEVRIPLSADAVISINAEAVRTDEDGKLALDFESMDAESFTHLRNVIRYSSSDPDAIDAELGGTPSEKC